MDTGDDCAPADPVVEPVADRRRIPPAAAALKRKGFQFDGPVEYPDESNVTVAPDPDPALQGFAIIDVDKTRVSTVSEFIKASHAPNSNNNSI